MSKLKIWSRLLHYRMLPNTLKQPPIPFLSTHFTSPTFSRNYRTKSSYSSDKAFYAEEERALQELDYQSQRERIRKREERLKLGLDTANLDEDSDDDYMGVNHLIEKFDKEDAAKKGGDDGQLYRMEEPTDSDTDDDDDGDYERYKQYQKKLNKHEELLDKFPKAGTLNDKYQWMKKIHKFEEKHLHPRMEYKVIAELLNRLKVAEGKDKFLLQMKLNRAVRMVEMREKFDANDPANYGVIENDEVGSSVGHLEHADIEKERAAIKKAKAEAGDDFEEIEFDDMKEKDTILLKKLNEIDKELEKKLAELDHTFGKKGKLLEEEIRDLAEERNSLTEEKRKPLYRRGFDVKLINVNRTCKITKGGQVIKYTAMLACGNYHGVVGFAKAKGPAIPIALQKAHEKCFQNLHYIERHEEHTIAHAIQTSYKKTKIYLWPAPTTTGMKAGRTVQTILSLAGFRNVKSKVVGSRNPHNTVKAVFKALNAIETPKDVQEKFGRTVVESYLL